MNSAAKTHRINYAGLFLSLISYFLMSYRVERHETGILLVCLIAVVLSYGYWMKNLEALPLYPFLIFSVFFRLIFIFSIPSLSDDFYRFAWDGRMWDSGMNPFSMTPREALGFEKTLEFRDLFHLVYGKDFPTVYPPIAQLFFWLAAKFSGDIFQFSLLLRIVMIFFEAGSIFLLHSILQSLKLNSNRILIYALNPLVILEFTGNLHHEGYVVFFLLLVIWFLLRKNINAAGIAFSGAVLSKILPLIYLPALVFIGGIKKWIKFLIIISGLILIGFYLISGEHFLQSLIRGIALYYERFEFNPSLWYLIRVLGFGGVGYNIIGSAGLILLVTAGILIFYLSLKKANRMLQDFDIPDLMDTWILILCIYLIFSTTIHPWYITPLIAFCCLGHFKFPLLWSCLILFTYLGYTETGYQESPLILMIEYGSVFIFFAMEWKKYISRSV